jgi:hypothetical protein
MFAAGRIRKNKYENYGFYSFLFKLYTGYTYILSPWTTLKIYDISFLALFIDPQDPELRKVETSFLLGPLLICAR